jgi:hypothetical protein
MEVSYEMNEKGMKNSILSKLSASVSILLRAALDELHGFTAVRVASNRIQPFLWQDPRCLIAEKDKE